MHVSFLDYLASPKTGKPLSLHIDERQGDFIETGRLVSGGEVYEIVRGVPRFVDFNREAYADSFGFQWNRWSRLQFENRAAIPRRSPAAAFHRADWPVFR